MAAKLSNIKKASSLIIASAAHKNTDLFDYRVLLLKRSKNLKSWPGLYVFPGGKMDDKIDESPEWLNIFLNNQQLRDLRSNQNLLNKYFSGFINKNTFGKMTDSNKQLPAELTYRLCSIRETFEETGILLAHEKSLIESPDFFQKANRLTRVYEMNGGLLNEWQLRVKQDSTAFLDMFLELGLVPDVLGLHEWSNWITPSFEKYRFNTLFFTCFLSKPPQQNMLKFDIDEVEKLEVR